MTGSVLPQRGRARVVRGVLGLIGLAIGVWLAAACNAGPPAASCTITWKGPVGGDFATPANWDLGRAPGATDKACASAGTSLVVSSTATVASVALDGALQIVPAGSLRVTDASKVHDLTLTGTMDGLSTITVASFHGSGGGVLTGAGTTNVTGSASVDGALTLRSGRVLSLGGSTALSGASVTVCDSAVLQVAGATEVSTASAIGGAGCATPPTTGLRVAGEGRLDATSGLAASVPIDNEGLLRVPGGVTLDAQSGMTQGAGVLDIASAATVTVGGGSGTLTAFGGTIQGSGQIAGSLTLLGATLAPGPTNGIGTFSVSGAITASSTAHLALDVAGTAAGTQLDSITSAGTVSLGSSTLDLTFPGGYVPASGSTYDIVSAATLTGTFGGVNVPAGTGHGLWARYQPTGVSLITTDCDSAKYHPGAYVPGQVLNGIDLRGCNLSGAYFTNTIELKNANLAGASFRGASVYVSKFDGSDLSGADLTGLKQQILPTFTGVTWSHTVCPDGTNSDANGGTCVGHHGQREFYVNTTGDFPDAYPGDGVCGAGACSLRAAIMEANTTPGADWIYAPSGTYTLTVAGSGEDGSKTGDLDITSSIVLYGGNIDGNGTERVLDVRPGGSLQVGGVTVQNGSTDALVRADGALLGTMGITATVGPALQVTGSASLLGSVITSAVAPAVDNRSWMYLGGTVDGGGVVNTGALESSATVKNAAVGIDNAGRVTLSGAVFDHNTTGLRNAGRASSTNDRFTGNATGLVNTGLLDGTGASFTGNTIVAADVGGAATLTASVFDANAAAIRATGTVTLANPTITNSTGPGPAVDAVTGSFTMRQATISGNAGGGVSAEGPAAITDSTIDANGAFELRVNGGLPTLSNSILAAKAPGVACVGTPGSNGWNLTSDTTCSLAGPSDLQAVDAKLRRLNANGPTAQLTQQLDPGSPAVDSGRGGCSGPDARGLVRPVDGDGDGTATCDRGAVEMPTYRPLHLVVNSQGSLADANPGDGVCATTAGECTLVAAFGESNASWGEDVIDLQSGGGYALPTPPLKSAVVIHGNGSGLGTWGISAVGDGDVSIDHLIIASDANGLTSRVPALHLADVTVYGVDTTSDTTIVRSSVGGVLSSGPLTIDHSSMKPWAMNGAGVQVGLKSAPGSTSAVLDSTISGGGLGVEAGGPVSLTRVTIAGNALGGVRALAAVTLVDSTITANSGGGIVAGASLVTATNSIIADPGVSPGSGPPPGANCDGPLHSLGWNLSSDASCGLAGPNDLSGVSAQLAPYGKVTPLVGVAVPMVGSPAIDSGKPGCSGVDGRGVARPSDGDGAGGAQCDRGAAEARTFRTVSMTVNSTVDAVDATPGDGICATATPGQCTLRAAVMESNAAPGTGTVTLAAGTYLPTLNGAPTDPPEDLASYGDLDVTSHLVVHGGNATIGNGAFATRGSATLALDHLTLDYSTVTTGPGRLTASDMTLQDGTALIAHGPADLVRVGIPTTSGIRAAYPVQVEGPTTVSASTIDSLTVAATATVAATTTTFGSVTSGGNLTIDRGHIGPVQVTGGSTTIRNTTVSGARGAPGVSVTGGTAALQSTTVADNDVGVSVTGGTLTLTGSIVADPHTGADCTGSVLSGGWNIASDASCSLAATADINGVDPKLGVFGHNGAPTANYLLMAGSPAIDTGPAGCSPTDQRGKPRVVDGNADGVATCDRGAIEAGVRRSLTLNVNGTSDAPDVNPGDGVCAGPSGFCNLRAAIMEANASNGTHTINLPKNGTFQLRTPVWGDDEVVAGGLDIAASVTINGNGATIRGASSSDSVIDVRRDVTVNLLDLKLDGYPGWYQAAINNPAGTVVTTRLTIGSDSGGVANAGTLRMSQGVISGVYNTGSMELTDMQAGLESESAGGSLSLLRSSLTGPIRVSGAGRALSAVDSTIDGAVTIDNGATATLTSATQAYGAFSVQLPSTGSATNSMFLSTCSGTISSGGWNLGTDASCDLHGATDAVVGDARTIRIRANGQRWVHLPLEGSPAIDSGRPGCSGADGRGAPRPADGDGDGVAGCDRGAVEVAAATPLSIVVNSTGAADDASPGDGVCQTATAGECTLNAAFTESNASTGADTISLQAGAVYLRPDADMSSAVTLHGNGSTIHGNEFNGPRYGEPIAFTSPGAVRVDGLSFDYFSKAAIDNRSPDAELDDIVVDSVMPRGIINRGTLTVRRFRAAKLGTYGYSFSESVPLDNSGTVVLEDSTFDNTPISRAGAITNTGQMTIRRSTLIRQGIVNAAGATISVSDSTLANSTVQVDGGAVDFTSSTIVGPGSAAITVASGAFTIHNSIIAAASGGTTCVGTITSTGYNLAGDSTCGLSQPTDVQGVNPDLGPLAANGGLTKTFLPNATSPVIGTGDPTCTGTDQRGVARPQGGACDRGAVEQ